MIGRESPCYSLYWEVSVNRPIGRHWALPHEVDPTVVYVNKRSGVGHLMRDCEYLTLVPDGALRVAHASSSSLPPVRMCRYCSPESLLAPSFDEPDHRADVTAA